MLSIGRGLSSGSRPFLLAGVPMRGFALAVWFVIVILFSVVVGSSSAHAQTATPYAPTPYPTLTPGPSPTPIPYATVLSASNDQEFIACVYTWYLGELAGSRPPVCYVVAILAYPESFEGAGDATMVSFDFGAAVQTVGQSSEKMTRRLILVPPAIVDSFSVNCSWSLYRTTHNVYPQAYFKNGGTMGGSALIDGGVWTLDSGGFYGLDSDGFGWSWIGTNNAQWWSNVYGGAWTFGNNKPYFEIDASQTSNGVPDQAAGAIFNCRIYDWTSRPNIDEWGGTPIPQMGPGGWVPPSLMTVTPTPCVGECTTPTVTPTFTDWPTETPTPAVTPTPTSAAPCLGGSWEPCFGDPDSWVPDDFITEEVPASFGLTAPGEAVCIMVLDEYDSGVITIFGYEVHIVWDYLQICMTPYGIYLVMFGWDIGELILHVSLASGFFLVARRIWKA